MSANKCTQGLKDDRNLSFGERWRWVTESRLIGIVACVIFNILVCSGVALTVLNDRARAASTANVAQPPPSLFVRLEGVEGLNPCVSPPAPPAFHLVVDADRIPTRHRYCSGGGNSMLRVSYHGMILAWGHVPWFCVDGSLTGHDVVTVEAKAEGALLREEVGCLVQGELRVEGKAEFDVEGEVAGLGYLRCKTFLFKDYDAAEESSLCLVQ